MTSIYRPPEPSRETIELTSDPQAQESHWAKTGTRIEQQELLSHTHGQHDYDIAPLWQRLLPLVTILLLTGLSGVGCYFTWAGVAFYFDSSIFQTATTNRNSVQVGIHILSSALSALWAFSLSATFSFVTREALVRAPVTLSTVRLYTAISRRSLEWSLPKRKLSVCVLVCILTVVPAWLWTGALTPQVSHVTVMGTIPVATAGEGSYAFLPTGSWNPAWNECFSTTQVNGTFSNCPGIYSSTKLLESASNALATAGGPRTHAKPDNSGQQYIGRSYGVGSSVGLVPSTIRQARRPVNLEYDELGYKTEATCIYNETTAFNFSRDTVSGDSPAHLFYAQGYLPNGEDQQFFIQADLAETPSSIVSMTGGVSADIAAADATYMIAIAAGSHYAQLDQIQCQLEFHPQRFTINASIYENTITLLKNSSDVPEFEPRGVLKNNVMRAFNGISLVQSTLYTSTLGDALMRNAAIFANNSEATLRIPSETDDTTIPIDPQSMLRAIELSMEAMADDTLGLLQATALTQAGSWTEQRLTAEVPVVRIGSTAYVACVLGVNLAALLGIVYFAITHRLFSSSPRFEYEDVALFAAAVHKGALRSMSDVEGHMGHSAMMTRQGAQSAVATFDLGGRRTDGHWPVITLSKAD